MPGYYEFTAVIIDDEQKARENMVYMIEQNCPDLEIVGQAWNRDTIKKIIFQTKPDIMFLDIQIGDTTIFEILDYEWVKNSTIIFTTAYSDYALEGYKFKASDYLLKPIKADDLKAVYDKIKNRNIEQGSTQTQTSKVSKLLLNDSEGMHILEVSEIMYLIGQGNYTSFHLKNEDKKIISKNLKSFEIKLSDFGFSRISKSCMVNIDFIKSFKKEDGGTLIMSDLKALHVSRSHKKHFLQQISDLAIT